MTMRSWMRRVVLGVSTGLLLLLALGVLAVTGDSPPAEAHCVEVPELEVWVCGTTTTTVGSTSTTATVPTTSTSVPATTTTTTSFEADECVLAQIEAEHFKYNTEVVDGVLVRAKTRFDIRLSKSTGGKLWIAPYLVDLGNGYGWLSGDRAGYFHAYMFLADLSTGQVHARVTFHRVDNPDSDTSYMKVNDKYMHEIQDTRLGYDGTCAAGTTDDPWSQAQAPEAATEYAIDNSPEIRPVIPIRVDGEIIEDRSYTNTVKIATDFIFDDGGRTGPFTDHNGVGGTPHTVYQRQIVLVKRDVGSGGLSIIGVVYYDSLAEDTTVGG